MKLKKSFSKKLKELTLKKYILLFAIIIVSLSILSLVFFNFSNKITRTKGIKIYYRTYSKEKGWTSWSQNGQINGKNYPIKQVEIKVKSKYLGDVFYNTYSNNKWMKNDNYSGLTSGNKKYNIDKIKIMLSDTLYKKYDLKYRIKYNNYWTEWGRNFYELEAKDSITNIQIEVTEKEVK